MKKILSLLLIILLTVNALQAQKKEKLVLIKTNMGNLKVKLYNQTPIHRDNFLKLVKQDFYDSLLFHRVINNFMIQGGDPESKNANKNAALGNGGPGYTISAEFDNSLIHKKGALAAARLGDNVNPKKESSGSQFYIVHGKTFTQTDLDNMIAQKTNQKKQQLYQEFFNNPQNESYLNKLKQLKQENNQQAIINFISEIEPLINTDSLITYSYTNEQIKIYNTIGGSPHLDGDYTVFGELVEGFEVLDKIAAVAVDPRNRPTENVIIIDMKVVKK